MTGFLIVLNMILGAAVLVAAASGLEKHSKSLTDDASEPFHVDAIRSSARFEFFSDLAYGIGAILLIDGFVLGLWWLIS